MATWRRGRNFYFGRMQFLFGYYTGKEPLETPDIIFDNSEYARLLPSRPCIGIITNGRLLGALTHRFAKHPVDWLSVSLDIDSGLHNSSINDQLLADLVAFREIGGSDAISSITVFTGENTEEVLSLGKKLCAARLDQWTISIFRTIHNGVEFSMVPVEKVRYFKRRLAEELGHITTTTILLDVTPEIFPALILSSPTPAEWRKTSKIRGMKNGFIDTIADTNKNRGHFIRLTYFGQLFSLTDMQNYTTTEGEYGIYEPGRLKQVFATMANERNQNII